MLDGRVGSVVEIESIPEFILSEISLVVDLHLLCSLDLGSDTSLVVLDGEPFLHVCAAVRSVRDEDRLA